MGLSCWGGDRTGLGGIPGFLCSSQHPQPATLLSKTLRHWSQQQLGPGKCVEEAGRRGPLCGTSSPTAKLHQRDRQMLSPGARDGRRGPPAPPQPVSPQHDSTRVDPGVWAVVSWFLSAATHSSGFAHCLPQKAALKNHGERAQSPTDPLARPRLFGGRTCRKDPRSN